MPATILAGQQVQDIFLVGEIKMWTALSVPNANWVFCDGSLLLRASYPELFALYDADGLPWGNGDGSTTFGIPDLRGKAPIGVGTGVGLTARALADSLGEENHALTAAENGLHSHGASGGSVTIPRADSAGGIPTSVAHLEAAGSGVQQFATINTSTYPVSGTTQNSGSGSGHNTMQPSLAVNFILRALP